MAAKYRLFNGKDGKFYFQLKAGNGQVILQSQGYTTKEAAQNGIASVQTNCSDDGCFDRKEAKDGSPYFSLKSMNGQIIGSSEMYRDTSGRDNGIDSVKTNGSAAAVDDETS